MSADNDAILTPINDATFPLNDAIPGLVAENDKLRRDLKNARSRLAQSAGVEQRAEKRATQAAEDAAAQRAIWLEVETEKRAIAAERDRYWNLAVQLGEALTMSGRENRDQYKAALLAFEAKKESRDAH